jgi:hypothetical protein
MHLEDQGKSVSYELSTAEPWHNNIFLFAPLAEYLKPRTRRLSKYLPAPFGRLPKIARSLHRLGGIKFFFSDFNPEGKVPERLPDFSLIDGYWQRLEYTHSLRSYMLDSPLFEILDAPLNPLKELYVHIRRGDFLSTDSALQLNFYEQAVAFILEHNEEIETVKVVTDDPDYCESSLNIPISFQVIRGQSAFDDFLTLVSAQYVLISRSTFSWWAARIGNGKVYYPTPWYQDKRELENSIIPDGWFGIPIESTPKFNHPQK